MPCLYNPALPKLLEMLDLHPIFSSAKMALLPGDGRSSDAIIKGNSRLAKAGLYKEGTAFPAIQAFLKIILVFYFLWD